MNENIHKKNVSLTHLFRQILIKRLFSDTQHTTIDNIKFFFYSHKLNIFFFGFFWTKNCNENKFKCSFKWFYINAARRCKLWPSSIRTLTAFVDTNSCFWWRHKKTQKKHCFSWLSFYAFELNGEILQWLNCILPAIYRLLELLLSWTLDSRGQ